MQQDVQGYPEQDTEADAQQGAQGYMEQNAAISRAVYEGDNVVAEVLVLYQNTWDGDLHVECPSKYAISKFQSIHSNDKEDRRWRFDCKEVYT